MQHLLEKLESEGPPPQAAAVFRDIMGKKYNWDVIAESYARLFQSVGDHITG